jgi:hypothetical protein
MLLKVDYTVKNLDQFKLKGSLRKVSSKNNNIEQKGGSLKEIKT